MSQSSDEPRIAQALRELTGALAETIEVSGLDAEPTAQRALWPCEDAGKRAFTISYDVIVPDPHRVVNAVVDHWRQRRFTVQVDRSRDHSQPEAIVKSRIFELSVHGFPDRSSVWVRGNTVCLPGEVPEDWRDVR
ncbi:hypothetical protein [Microtetraspora sp. NBRC 16547]|uniref:hypothetical protein n=1 Tax=Microtetraspora sp. NBRC 16547 TaxID=3030993 RepID=UPI0024A24360|nr:hypothetical protein [Microtetraspora sp. NBRC 16547]GLW97179.1 hypothetical protein Misp02_12660 [Microtetraspora sp. NBRC 16547]